MATTNCANTCVELETLDNRNHPTFGTTRLDAIAELASQQPYLVAPISEPPARGMLLLAKAAVLILHPDSNGDTTTGTKRTTTSNTAAAGTTDTGDDSAEEVIEVRPMKRAKTSAWHTASSPAPGSRRRSTRSFSASQRQITAEKAVTKRASHVSAPAFQLPPSPSNKAEPVEEMKMKLRRRTTGL